MTRDARQSFFSANVPTSLSSLMEPVNLSGSVASSSLVFNFSAPSNGRPRSKSESYCSVISHLRYRNTNTKLCPISSSVSTQAVLVKVNKAQLPFGVAATISNTHARSRFSTLTFAPVPLMTRGMQPSIILSSAPFPVQICPWSLFANIIARTIDDLLSSSKIFCIITFSCCLFAFFSLHESFLSSTPFYRSRKLV